MRSRSFAKLTAVVYAVVAVVGSIPGLGTVLGILPLYGHDAWLHALITIVAAYFGFAAGPEEPLIADRVGPPP
ncbi:MAG: DUF4383 domain-containing protein [Geminicoccaceae bacterium]